ncbi:MAG: hypothetical protein HQ464_01550 [Planctomycetes bacterium]|nr:hypothetical protein [Planctomycetota bacterium]
MKELRRWWDGVVRSVVIVQAVAIVGACRFAAADGPVFDVRECLGENWTDERLVFPLTLPEGLDPRGLCVEVEGVQLPAQFTPGPSGGSEGTVSFVDSLPAFSRKTWALTNRPAIMPKSDLFIRETPKGLVLGTSRITVLCPAGRRQWEDGLPIAEAPPPVIAVSLLGGPSLAAGALTGHHRVTSIESEIIEEGPVSARVAVRYHFQGGGEWSVGMEAIAGQEVILVTEELNLEEHGGFLEAIRPPGSSEGNYIMRAYGQRLRERGSAWQLRFDGLEADRIAWQPMGNTWPGNRLEPDNWGDFAVPRDAGPIMTLHPAHGEWWLNASPWAGFYRRTGEAYLGVLTLHAGAWRGLDENAIVVEKTESGSVQAVLPITTGARRWALYAAPRVLAAPPLRPEAAPAERPGRDHSRPPQLATLKYGLLPLNTVKDWILRFADPPGITYPFLIIRPAELQRLRARASADPEIMPRVQSAADAWSTYATRREPRYPFHASWLTSSMMLEDLYLATGRVEYADAMAALLEERVRYHVHQAKSGIGATGYRLGHDYGMFHVAINVLPRAIREADLVLGAPNVAAARKANIRALLAFWAELLMSSDYQPEGRNNGNTDMVACRDVMVGAIGCLLPGHPRAATWRAVAAGRIDHVLDAREHLPGLTQDEWYGHLSLDLCVWSAVVLKRAGDRDFFQDQRLRGGLDFYGQLLVPPDPRHGFGYVAPFGNGQAQWNRSAQWGLAAGAAGRDDPDFASRMMWYWIRAGRPLTLKFMSSNDIGLTMLAWIDESVKPRNPRLESTSLEGWGVVFRDRCGARDETYLAMQAGKPGGLSHYNAEGGLQYHALGVPVTVVPGIRSYDVEVNGNQANVTRQRWMANRPSFSDSSELEQGTGKLTGWVPSASADYACAEWQFSRFEALPLPQPSTGPDALVLSSPRGIGNSGVPGIFEIPAPVRWRRQMLFVKPRSDEGVPYVVVRDDVRASVPWDWSIWCLSLAQQATEHGGFFTGKYGVNLAVIPLDTCDDVVTGHYGPTASFAGDYRQQVYQVRFPAERRSFTALLYPWRQGGKPPVVLPDEVANGVRLTVPGEVHTVSTGAGGMALVREAAEKKNISIFGGMGAVASDGDRVAIEGPRDASGLVEVTFAPGMVSGETRGQSRTIVIGSAEIMKGTATMDGVSINADRDGAGRIRLAAPDGRKRFRVE